MTNIGINVSYRVVPGLTSYGSLLSALNWHDEEMCIAKAQ
jgi:hypothetical protein